MCTNSGETLFLSDENDFKKYVSDTLGQDFSDCLVPSAQCDVAMTLLNLLDKLNSACEEVENIDNHYASKSPVLELKKHRKAFVLIQECRDTLEELLYDYD